MRNPTTSWSELRVLARFNPIGLFQSDAAALLRSHGVGNIRTSLHKGKAGVIFKDFNKETLLKSSFSVKCPICH